MAGVAESLQDRLRSGGSIAVFGHDPRIYQTTVKEFLKDKNGNLNGIITVKLESKRMKKPDAW